MTNIEVYAVFATAFIISSLFIWWFARNPRLENVTLGSFLIMFTGTSFLTILLALLYNYHKNQLYVTISISHFALLVVSCMYIANYRKQ